MPRGGPAYPFPDELRERLPKRLRELGWSFTDLAEKVGVTRSAISHLIKHGTQTSLLPDILEAVGWKDDEWKKAQDRLASPSSADPPTDSLQESSKELAEMITSFLSLCPENRSRMLERARVLREEELRYRDQKPPNKK